MSTRGRKAKPSAIKKLEGNPGKRPLNKREPKPQTAVKKPRGMQKGAQKFWEEYAPELERLGVLTGVDVGAFRLMAEHYRIAMWALKELDIEGLTVEGREGPKKNPVAQIFKDNSAAFVKYAALFGMTPSDRSRLQLPKEAEQLSLADLLFKAATEGK